MELRRLFISAHAENSDLYLRNGLGIADCPPLPVRTSEKVCAPHHGNYHLCRDDVRPGPTELVAENSRAVHDRGPLATAIPYGNCFGRVALRRTGLALAQCPAETGVATDRQTGAGRSADRLAVGEPQGALPDRSDRYPAYPMREETARLLAGRRTRKADNLSVAASDWSNMAAKPP